MHFKIPSELKGKFLYILRSFDIFSNSKIDWGLFIVDCHSNCKSAEEKGKHMSTLIDEFAITLDVCMNMLLNKFFHMCIGYWYMTFTV